MQGLGNGGLDMRHVLVVLNLFQTHGQPFICVWGPLREETTDELECELASKDAKLTLLEHKKQERRTLAMTVLI